MTHGMEHFDHRSDEPPRRGRRSRREPDAKMLLAWLAALAILVAVVIILL